MVKNLNPIKGTIIPVTKGNIIPYDPKNQGESISGKTYKTRGKIPTMNEPMSYLLLKKWWFSSDRHVILFGRRFSWLGSIKNRGAYLQLKSHDSQSSTPSFAESAFRQLGSNKTRKSSLFGGKTIKEDWISLNLNSQKLWKVFLCSKITCWTWESFHIRIGTFCFRVCQRKYLSHFSIASSPPYERWWVAETEISVKNLGQQKTQRFWENDIIS